MTRRLPIGAEVQPAANGGGVHFRVWAPDRKSVAVVIDDHATPLTREEGGHENDGPEGYFSGLIPSAGDGTRYKLKLDDNDYLFPDMASRFQPEGPHGPSQVVDHTRFTWTDSHWRGCTLEGQVLYEMHIGPYTEDTWQAMTGTMATGEALAKIAVPALILKADASPDVRKTHQEAASVMQKGRLVHIDGAGHNLHHDELARTVEVLTQFLSTP